MLKKTGLALLAVLLGWQALLLSSLFWARPYASWRAQTAAPVGVTEADVRAGMGQPRQVWDRDYQGRRFFRRPIEHHALLYSTRTLLCLNWIVVYVDRDGLVTCSVATTRGSD